MMTDGGKSVKKLEFRGSMDGEVVIRKFSFPHEAELSANYLREHEIRARVDSNVLVNLDPFYSDAFGGIRLHVPERDAGRADELLLELEAATKAARAERDPMTLADRTAERALNGAVLGIVLPVLANFLSLWLVLRVDWNALSEKGRRRVMIAIAIDLAALAIVGLVIAYGSAW
jgi:hypothetical protein